MKIITINIQAAGVPRAKSLLEWLDGRDDDVVILTETSSGPGTRYLLEAYRAIGWQVVTTEAPGDRGCALVTRLPARPVALAVSLPGRCAAVAVDSSPCILVVGVYVPSNDRTKAAKKRNFLADLVQALAPHCTDTGIEVILGGDYNLVTRDHEPAYPGVFADSDYAFLDALAHLGLVDAHRHLHPADQPHSWVGHRGHPYRYDYFHVAAALAARLTSSTYLQHTREAGLSDHAAVGAGLAVSVNRLGEAGQLAARAGTLF